MIVIIVRKRWEHEEIEKFDSIWTKECGRMPTQNEIKRLSDMLPSRTTAVLRARASNLLRTLKRQKLAD
jgi:hypothetical protein